jgi:hypothetical protein
MGLSGLSQLPDEVLASILIRVVKPRSFQEPAVELIGWDYSSNCLTSEYMEWDEEFLEYREPHRACDDCARLSLADTLDS